MEKSNSSSSSEEEVNDAEELRGIEEQEERTFRRAVLPNRNYSPGARLRNFRRARQALGLLGPPGGLKGQKGDSGRDGEKGYLGLPGTPGPCKGGLIGPPGPEGPRGYHGPAGSKGEDGITGLPATSPGPGGLPGGQGLPGRDGLEGLRGPKGAKGDAGYPGLPGERAGIPGASGASGPQGPPGQKGMSIQGPKRMDGVNGRDGLPGLKGERGFPGSPGIPDDSKLGRPGPPGGTGDKGFPGRDGVPGRPGIPGPPGFKGEPGGTCPDCRPGEPGLKGDRGFIPYSFQSLSEQFDTINDKLSELSMERDALKSRIKQLEGRVVETKENVETEAMQRYNELLNVCLQQYEGIVRKTIEDLDHSLLTGGTGALDHFLISCKATPQVIQLMEVTTGDGISNFAALKNVMEQVPLFSHHIVNLMVHGSASSRTSPDIQKGDEMLSDCRNLGSCVLTLLSTLRKRGGADQLSTLYGDLRDKFEKLTKTAGSLGSNLTSEVDAADALEKELLAMEKSIDEARKQMEDMLKKSRASHTGMKLEVNEKLIDSCTTLVEAIRLLVQRAKGLQTEIVVQGKGSASVKEFYKRNHQWTEGLISAAKAVGAGAKFLLENADNAVSNLTSGFELLIASSQDIAASTIQLVMASQVRADRSSQNLSLLKKASTGVKMATAGVVTTARECSQLIEDSHELDLEKLSTHNTKRMELETQAEVLRLETELEKSRMKLAALRRHHYHNAD